MKKYILAMFCAALAPVLQAADTGHSCDAFESSTVLFEGGDGISKFYRIPAIVTLPDGRLVVAADRRYDSNNDLPGRIDVVCRSSSDGGATWGTTVVVASSDSIGGYGDPALGVDSISGDVVCVMAHGPGFWSPDPDNHILVYTSRSTDGGATWSRPEDITDCLLSRVEGEASLTAIGGFASSGHILTASDGSMWFSLVTRTRETPWSEVDAHPVRSTDGGLTWTALKASADADADEAKIVELPDGELLMSIRNRRRGFRKFARSTDRGVSWTEPVHSTTLPDPACNGDIILLPDGRLMHSVPDSSAGRENVSLFVSSDTGNSWRKVATVCHGSSAYSALTLIDDSHVGVVCEEASANGGYKLVFHRVDLEKLPLQ